MRKRERERLKEKKRDFSQRLENHGEYSIKLFWSRCPFSFSPPFSLSLSLSLTFSLILSNNDETLGFKRVREAIITISADKSSKSILAKFISKGPAEKSHKKASLIRAHFLMRA